MSHSSTTPVGQTLQDLLQRVSTYDAQKVSPAVDQVVHVPNVGSELSSAYEQLRNASENIEDHLLFQRSIKRFYRRAMVLSPDSQVDHIGNELIIELTQAGYIENSTVNVAVAKQIDDLVRDYRSLYGRIIKTGKVLQADATRWMLELLSIRTEHVFNPPIRALSFAYIAHAHLTPLVSVGSHIVKGEQVAQEDHDMILYVGVHKALLKSDDANIRNALIDAYKIEPRRLSAFIEFNAHYDELTKLKTTAAVARTISINGAPLRAVNSTFFRDSSQHLSIENQNTTLGIVQAQLDSDYTQTHDNLRRGIVKSIIFLILTKVIVGLLIEIPYDLIVYSQILLIPLIINLFAPPLILALNTLTVRLPSETNKRAVVDYIDAMLYGDQPLRPLRTNTVDASGVFTAIYGVIALAVITALGLGLYTIGFNIVQGLIFFVFLSTALFLGYRLSLQVRELELVRADQGFLELLRDFVYTPFIFIGHKISYRFAQLNIISQILDVLVELPLKTFLRLVRQWTTFLNNRKDELL